VRSASAAANRRWIKNASHGSPVSHEGFDFSGCRVSFAPLKGRSREKVAKETKPACLTMRGLCSVGIEIVTLPDDKVLGSGSPSATATFKVSAGIHKVLIVK